MPLFPIKTITPITAPITAPITVPFIVSPAITPIVVPIKPIINIRQTTVQPSELFELSLLDLVCSAVECVGVGLCDTVREDEGVDDALGVEVVLIE